ncbi:MAG: hypothetical protein Q7S19_03330 [bacterium]|nr:hypothetical protein [bacterium]
MKSPEKVEHVVFNAGAKITQKQKDGLLHFVRNNRFLDEAEISKENLTLVSKLKNNYLAWGKKILGIDLSERAPDSTRVHIQPKDSAKALEISSRHRGADETLSGYAVREAEEIVIWEKTDRQSIKETLNHEFTHIFSHKSMIVKEQDKKFGLKIQNTGYSNLNNTRTTESGEKEESPILAGFDEMMTETINIEVLNNLKKENGQDYLEMSVGYYPGVLLLDMIIEKIAEKTKQNEKDIRKNLYRGYFQGKMGELRAIKNVFGLEAMNFLSRVKPLNLMDAGSMFASAEDIFKLDSQKYFSKVLDYEEGATITLSNGIKIKKYFPEI